MTATVGKGRRTLPWWQRLSAVVDMAAASHRNAVALLVAACLLSFLPGFFSLPPIDRDEARFAQATKQMVETGDYIDIRFQDEVRYKKPVGIYWLQAAAVRAGDALGVERAHTTIWLYRIPSLIGAIGAVLLTYWTALAFVSRRAAFLAGLMLAASVLLNVEARLAKTDAMLLLTALAVMGVLARFYLPEQRARIGVAAGWALPALFWTALAGGILLKGPLILMLAGLAVAALAVVDRSARWLLALRPLPGLIWLLLLVLPWFLAIVSRSGDDFFAKSVGDDLLAKVASGQESHGAPPGLYFVLFWATFWPAATLAAFAVPAVWRARREPGVKFLLAWIAPSWIVFEAVITKLPHYVLPLYPAIAILIAGAIDARLLVMPRWLRQGTAWWFAFPATIGAASIGATVYFGHPFAPGVWLAAAAATACGFLAWRLFEPEAAERSLLSASAASMLCMAVALGLVAPAVSILFPNAALARLVGQIDCRDPQVALVGYHEPSTVFLLGTATRLAKAPEAAEFLAAGGCRLAVVEGRRLTEFINSAKAIGLSYNAGPRIEGINISGGARMMLHVYRAPPAP